MTITLVQSLDLNTSDNFSYRIFSVAEAKGQFYKQNLFLFHNANKQLLTLEICSMQFSQKYIKCVRSYLKSDI